jgi:hypothetical protein
MDVNGYILLINGAVKIEAVKPDANSEIISLEAMAASFDLHHTWHDLKDPDSDLSKFLAAACGQNGGLAVNKLKVLGILWCDGEPEEKIDEFYDILQEKH